MHSLIIPAPTPGLFCVAEMTKPLPLLLLEVQRSIIKFEGFEIEKPFEIVSEYAAEPKTLQFVIERLFKTASPLPSAIPPLGPSLLPPQLSSDTESIVKLAKPWGMQIPAYEAFLMVPLRISIEIFG